MYFITICTKNRKYLLSKIIEEKLILSEYGKLVKQEIIKTEKLRKNVKIDCYVIMPNHVHMIIEIKTVGVACYATQSQDMRKKSKEIIPKIVQQLKTITIKLADKYIIENRVA